MRIVVNVIKMAVRDLSGTHVIMVIADSQSVLCQIQNGHIRYEWTHGINTSQLQSLV